MLLQPQVFEQSLFLFWWTFSSTIVKNLSLQSGERARIEFESWFTSGDIHRWILASANLGLEEAHDFRSWRKERWRKEGMQSITSSVLEHFAMTWCEGETVCFRKIGCADQKRPDTEFCMKWVLSGSIADANFKGIGQKQQLSLP